jgi:transposase InsO family protein
MSQPEDEDEEDDADDEFPDSFPGVKDVPFPYPKTRHRGTLARPLERPRMPLSPQQKLLLLDTWQRSGLPARDFGALVNISRHTLYAWKRRFEELGPAGLMDQPRGAKPGSKLSDLTKRAILMLKQAHPDWGCERISDMLVRGPALAASPNAVARVLREAGYELQEQPTRPHPDHVRRFERAASNQLWQTDLFTFVLKRQNRRVYLVGFLDDHSRFITGYGLHGSQSTALVLEVFRAAIAGYGVPGEVLTDNGTQYVTWRGKSQFTRELEKLGVRQIVARPKRPQTLGKIERFWGTLWRECIESAVFVDLEDARRRIGLFIDHYNFQRVHSGVEGLVPADRFFHAAPEILSTLKQRVAANALELARHGVPKKPFYLTGQVQGQPFSVHQEGDRVILRQAGAEREEIELVPPPTAAISGEELPPPVCPQGVPASYGVLPEELPPGVSALDEYLAQPPAAEEGAPS